MKRALVIGTGGIGGAIAMGLEAAGWQVETLSRQNDGLDFAQPAATQAVLEQMDGPFQRVVVATGALAPDGQGPEKSMRALSPDALQKMFAINAIGPAMVLQQARRWLPKKEAAVMAVLSARVGSITDNQLGGWYSYRASKAALNQLLRTASIELARSHPQACCLALHPGTVETSFTADYRARHPMISTKDAAKRLISVMDNATPSQNGSFLENAGQQIPW